MQINKEHNCVKAQILADQAVILNASAASRRGLINAIEVAISYLVNPDEFAKDRNLNYMHVRILQAILHLSLVCPLTMTSLALWDESVLEEEMYANMDAAQKFTFLDYVFISDTDHGKLVVEDARKLLKKLL